MSSIFAADVRYFDLRCYDRKPDLTTDVTCRFMKIQVLTDRVRQLKYDHLLLPRDFLQTYQKVDATHLRSPGKPQNRMSSWVAPSAATADEVASNVVQSPTSHGNRQEAIPMKTWTQMSSARCLQIGTPTLFLRNSTPLVQILVPLPCEAGRLEGNINSQVKSGF
jgi:hypothetical protein